MVDAVYGTLLWSAGSSTSTSTFKNARMTHSIPVNVPVFDTDGDGYADRIYVGDMAGQLWRFDIVNGATVTNLVRGGVFASLGTKEDSTHTTANTRRFYSAPDVSVVQRNNAPPYINIAIGSGYRGHPADEDNHDRFYAVRDYDPFMQLTQAEYDLRDDPGRLILDGDLQDITTQVQPTLAADAKGWKMTLDERGAGTWVGEKVLVPARTFDGKVFFTTYSPNTSNSSTDPCANLGTGTNRVYVVNVADGSPVLDRNSDGTITTADRSEDLAQGGIAPETSFLFPPPADPAPCIGNNCQPPPPGDPVVCLSGVEVLNVCTNLDRRVKTFWRDTSTE
jgi:type IV pilus assembly protein PilY1